MSMLDDLHGDAIRVLVVDDDPHLTYVVSTALQRASYDAIAVPDGESALRLCATWQPRLVVLDILMPGIDGLEVCRRLRSGGDGPLVLMLTAKDATSDQLAGLAAGADDYLIKPFSIEVLVAHVGALVRRAEHTMPSHLRYADLELDPGAHVARRRGREIRLTSTEYRLLRELLRTPQQAIAREDLIQRVWGYDFDGNYNVLEVYVSYLRSKLERGGEPRLIQTLRGTGYVLREIA